MNAEDRSKRLHDEAMKLVREAQRLRDRGEVWEAMSCYESALQTEELAARGDVAHKAFYCKCAAIMAFSMGDGEQVERYVNMGLACNPEPKLANELSALKMRAIHEQWNRERRAARAGR